MAHRLLAYELNKSIICSFVYINFLIYFLLIYSLEIIFKIANMSNNFSKLKISRVKFLPQKSMLPKNILKHILLVNIFNNINAMKPGSNEPISSSSTISVSTTSSRITPANNFTVVSTKTMPSVSKKQASNTTASIEMLTSNHDTTSITIPSASSGLEEKKSNMEIIEEFSRNLPHDNHSVAIKMFLNTELVIKSDMEELNKLIYAMSDSANTKTRLRYIVAYLEKQDEATVEYNKSVTNKKQRWDFALIRTSQSNIGGSELQLIRLCAAKLSDSIQDEDEVQYAQLKDYILKFNDNILDESQHHQLLIKLSNIIKLFPEDEFNSAARAALEHVEGREYYIGQDKMHRAILELSDSHDKKDMLIYFLLKEMEIATSENKIHDKESFENACNTLQSSCKNLFFASIVPVVTFGLTILGAYLVLKYFDALKDIRDLVNEIPTIKGDISTLRRQFDFVQYMLAGLIKIAPNVTLGIQQIDNEIHFGIETGTTIAQGFSNITGQAITDANTITKYLQALCVMFKCQ